MIQRNALCAVSFPVIDERLGHLRSVVHGHFHHLGVDYRWHLRDLLVLNHDIAEPYHLYNHWLLATRIDINAAQLRIHICANGACGIDPYVGRFVGVPKDRGQIIDRA